MSKSEMANYLREHRDSFPEYSDEQIRFVLAQWEEEQRVASILWDEIIHPDLEAIAKRDAFLKKGDELLKNIQKMQDGGTMLDF